MDNFDRMEPSIVQMLTKRLNREWFDKVRSGMKIYEGRVKINDWVRIEVGNIIEFYCDDDSVKILVTEVLSFNNFEDALQLYGNLMLPGRCIDEWNDVYYNIYNRELVEKNGVILLRLELLD